MRIRPPTQAGLLRCLAPVAMLACRGAWADSGLNDQTLQQPFQVSATIQPGCVLGSGGTDVSSYGTIDFGQVATLPANVDVASTGGAGSIVLQCTPGTSVAIALGGGLNPGGGRNLKNTSTTETLGYQLYQDANRNTVWGDGSNGGNAMSVVIGSSAVQTLTVYARLFARTPTPSAGIYQDTVVVTVSY